MSSAGQRGEGSGGRSSTLDLLQRKRGSQHPGGSPSPSTAQLETLVRWVVRLKGLVLGAVACWPCGSCCGGQPALGGGSCVASKPLAPMQSTAPPLKASKRLGHLEREAAACWAVCSLSLQCGWVFSFGRQVQPGSGSRVPARPSSRTRCSLQRALRRQLFKPRARGPPVGRVDAAAGAAVFGRPYAAACDACVRASRAAASPANSPASALQPAGSPASATSGCVSCPISGRRPLGPCSSSGFILCWCS